MEVFKHESQEVYQASLELVAALDRLTRNFSPGRAVVGDQLTQAALAVVREVAAGTGQPGGGDAERILHEALNTTLQIAALLDVVRTLRLTDDESIEMCRQVVLRIAGLLSDKLGAKP